MSRIVVFILKLLAGTYLVYVGVTLLRRILEVHPGNLEMMCGIAAVFILSGAGYLIGLLGSSIKKGLDARAAGRADVSDMEVPSRPVRDQSLFRTAPMAVGVNIQTLQAGTEPLPEQGAAASRSTSATVKLQTVGPDTIVWKNDHKEK